VNPSFHFGPSAKYRRAFSLIELIIVMVIVGAVSAIAIPRYANSYARYRVESAVASSITDSSQADSAAGADIDALLHDDDPTAATSLAQRVNQVSRYRPGLLEDRRDAFKPSAGWVGVDGSGSGLPTNADGFRAAYELVALMPKNRRPCAMVGGRTVFVGQTLDGFTLVEVGARSAVFESAAGRVELKMGDGAASH